MCFSGSLQPIVFREMPGIKTDFKEGIAMLPDSEEFIRMPLHWQIVSLLRFWHSGDNDEYMQT